MGKQKQRTLVVRCSECGQQNPVSSKFCGKCGATLPVATPEAKPKRGRLWWVAFGLFGCCALAALGMFMQNLTGNDDETAGRATSIAPVEQVVAGETQLPQATNTPMPTHTPIPTVPPFAEVEATIEGMTEVQWKAYLEGLKGHRIEDWTGTIVDVDQGLMGDYEAWIDMDEPSALSVQDVYCPVGEELAISLNKGAKVRFSGTVKRASEMLGSVSFTLEDGATLQVVSSE